MGEKRTYWVELAQDMEGGHYTTDPARTVTGEAAAMLREAFGTDDLEQIEAVRRGTPVPEAAGGEAGGGVEDAAGAGHTGQGGGPG